MSKGHDEVAHYQASLGFVISKMKSAKINSDIRGMKLALALARRGGKDVRPNPQVGAVVVQDGKVVGYGWHKKAGGPHAEVFALEMAGAKAKGATVYVSLEPCSHQGKTPPCVDALIKAGVGRVVIGAKDINPDVAGDGARKLREAGIAVENAICEVQSQALLDSWFHTVSVKRPFVRWCVFSSLSGGSVAVERALPHLTGSLKRQIVSFMSGVDLNVVDESGKHFLDSLPKIESPTELQSPGMKHSVKNTLRSVTEKKGESISLVGSSALAASWLGERALDEIMVISLPLLGGEESTFISEIQPKLKLVATRRFGECALSRYNVES